MSHIMLVEELAGTRDPDHGKGFPATELSKALLLCAGGEVVKRNQQGTYHIVEGLRDIYDEINPVIRTTNKSLNDGLYDADKLWVEFDGYLGAINTLEAALFEVLDSPENEEPETFSSVEAHIEEAERWAMKWRELPYFFDRFGDKFPILRRRGIAQQEEIWSSVKRDTTTFFSSMVRKIEDHRFSEKVDQQVEDVFNKVKSVLQELRTVFHRVNKFVMMFAVKFVLVVHGVIKTIAHPQAAKKVLLYLRSITIWSALHDFVTRVREATGDPESAACEEKLVNVYIIVIKVMRAGPGMEISMSYLEMVKLTPFVRRPYLSRSHALVTLCRTLAELSQGSNEDDSRNQEITELLETSFQLSIKALNTAITTSEHTSIADLPVAEFKDVNAAFKSAQENIETCYDRFKARNRWETLKETTLKAAEAKDKEHLKLIKTKLKLEDLQKEDLINVTVTVLDDLASESAPEDKTIGTLSVTPATRLEAIRWSVIRYKNLDQRLYQRAQDAPGFYKDGKEYYSMDTAVKDMGVRDTCTLQLILSDHVV